MSDCGDCGGDAGGDCGGTTDDCGWSGGGGGCETVEDSSPAPVCDPDPQPEDRGTFDYSEHIEMGHIGLGLTETRRLSTSSTSSSSSSSSSSSISSIGGGHSKKMKKSHVKPVAPVVVPRGGPVNWKQAWCWMCAMIGLFIILTIIMLYMYFADDFTITQPRKKVSKNSNNYSNDPFTGVYERDLLNSDFSPKSASRSLFSLAYKLGEGEDKITIERKGSGRSYQMLTKPRLAFGNEQKMWFDDGVPFQLTRISDGETVNVTIKIKGKVWKEEHQSYKNPKKNVEIRREFDANGVTVTYESEKTIYVKRFKRVE